MSPHVSDATLSAIEIRTLTDESEAIALGRAAGLEDSDGDTEGLLVRWGAFHGSRLVGTVALRHWQDMFIVGWTAVHEDYRRAGLGRRLLGVLEGEALARGAGRLWVCAREPEFYLKNGFVEALAGRETDLLLGPCSDCPQFRVNCHPIAATKPLGR